MIEFLIYSVAYTTLLQSPGLVVISYRYSNVNLYQKKNLFCTYIIQLGFVSQVSCSRTSFIHFPKLYFQNCNVFPSVADVEFFPNYYLFFPSFFDYMISRFSFFRFFFLMGRMPIVQAKIYIFLISLKVRCGPVTQFLSNEIPIKAVGQDFQEIQPKKEQKDQ